MIVCNGIVGVCLLAGGARHHEQTFQLQGASVALAVLAALTVLTLVLPNFTTSTPGPSFSTAQLAFEVVVFCSRSTAHSSSCRRCATATISCRSATTRRGTRRHRRTATAPTSAGLFLVSLVAIVASAGAHRDDRARGGAPRPAARRGGDHHRGTGAAARGTGGAARRASEPAADEPQPRARSRPRPSAWTISAVACACDHHQPAARARPAPSRGGATAPTLLVSVITLGTGRTTVLPGVVHLVIFAVFLFFAMVP